MTTSIKTLFAIQDPFDIGTDENDRVVYVTNYNYRVDDASGFLANLLTYMQNNSIGTKGTNLFSGSKAVLPSPENQDPVVLVVQTGGLPPDRPIEQGSVINRGSFQVSVRSLQRATAESKSYAVFALLDDIANTSIP